MEVERKIRRVGNSLGITLPSDMLKNIGIEEGDSVYVSSEGNKIVIRNDPGDDQEDEFKQKVIAILEEHLKSKD
jgi:putative addiction module antidote